MKKKFKCRIDCANCAARLEKEIRKIDGVEDVRVNFLMQKMTLTADDGVFDSVLQTVLEKAKKIEPDICITAE